MAKTKVDGVVEAVRYTPQGQVAWVRAYLRRGPTFSDRLLLDRQALVDQLKAGKRFFSGSRLTYLAGTFELRQPLQLQQKNGQVIVVAGAAQAERDHLEGVPVL